jgi:flap endonuclease-1
LGCDYCDSIKGIGPKRAIDLIKQHRNLETVLKNIDKNKYSVAEDWMYEEARQLFLQPEVTDPETIEVSFAGSPSRNLTDMRISGITEARSYKSVFFIIWHKNLCLKCSISLLEKYHLSTPYLNSV